MYRTRRRNNSPASLLVVAILLCSIVCSVTNVFGRVIVAQSNRVVSKESTTTQVTTQLAEKAESETKTESENKYHTPFFVIQSVIQIFGFDIAAPGCSGLVYEGRLGRFRNLIPLFLIQRTIQI